MQYVSGIPAFGVPCNLKSCGKWNCRKDDFLDEKKFTLRESDESPFKNWGIEENKLVPYRELCLYNVANHVRAYCDMLYEERFDELEGVFAECIDDASCRKDIFVLAYGKLRYLACFHEVNEFLTREFGNAWLSYIDAVQSVAEHMQNVKDEEEALKILQSVNITE